MTLPLPEQLFPIGTVRNGQRVVRHDAAGNAIWKSITTTGPGGTTTPVPTWSGTGEMPVGSRCLAELAAGFTLAAGATVAFTAQSTASVRGSGGAAPHVINYGTWRMLGTVTAPWSVVAADIIRVS